MQRQPARRLTLALSGLLLLTACGGDDEPEVLPEVAAFGEAREALLAAESGGYDWRVSIKAFPTPLVDESVCWDSPEQPPAVEAVAEAEAYGAHRGDTTLVDVDIPATLALTLLGVEDAVLSRSPLEPEDLAPAVVGVEDGRIVTVTINGPAVARRLSDDDVPVDADLRSHAGLATAEVVLGADC